MQWTDILLRTSSAHWNCGNSDCNIPANLLANVSYPCPNGYFNSISDTVTDSITNNKSDRSKNCRAQLDTHVTTDHGAAIGTAERATHPQSICCGWSSHCSSDSSPHGSYSAAKRCAYSGTDITGLVPNVHGEPDQHGHFE